jgi:hypothetical protein
MIDQTSQGSISSTARRRCPVQCEPPLFSPSLSQQLGHLSPLVAATPGWIAEETFSQLASAPHPTLLTFDGKLHGRPVKVLVDCGASSNFVSTTFVAQHGLETVPANKPFVVRLADGQRQACAEALPKSSLHIRRYKDKLDLHILPIKNFDVILGMPWLRQYKPYIDWDAGILTFDKGRTRCCLAPPKPAAPSCLLTAKQFAACLNDDEHECFALTADCYESLLSVETVANRATAADPLPNTMHPEAQRLLDQYADVFPDSMPCLPPHRDIEHAIELVEGGRPVARAPYRLSVKEENELKIRLKELLDAGYIRPSKSPWAAPTLFVAKKDGSLRFCVDYRGLNKVTKRDQHPLPLPEDQFRRLHGAKIFSKLDLMSGYYQIRMEESSIDKTAFTTPYGLYEFTVMPFGLTNAPATFSRLMQDVLKDFLHDFVLVYLDDILIYSKNEIEHAQHLEMVLQKLQENQLYAKLSKCCFFQQSVEYLGFVVSANGVSMADDKLRAITEWPTPTTASDVKSFLGLTGFYRNFVKHYAHIASPLNELTSVKTKFAWTPLHQGHFEWLKKAMTSAPVLQVYNPLKPCFVYTDASNVAVGAVLMQADEDDNLRPVAFFSRKLNPAQRNYDARTREFLAIKLVSQKWRAYLHNGLTSVFYTDHESLQYLNTSTDLGGKFARWYAHVTSWIGVPEIKYKPGKLNVVADALSRRPDHLLNAISLVMPTEELLQRIRTATTGDAFATQIAATLTAHSDYVFENGLLYRVDGTRRQLYVPDVDDLREMLLHEYHDAPLAGHLGRVRTLKALQSHYGWPNMKKDVADYIASCDVCQRTKTSTQPSSGLLQPLELPTAPWHSISMDFVTHLPTTSDGYDSLLVVVDRFSKYVELIPTVSTVDAVTTASLVFNNIVCRYGCPSSIVSDRDPRFVSEFWTALWERFGSKLKLSTAYHPQTDGQTERMNRTVEQMLRAYCLNEPDRWKEHLPAIQFAYNASINASSKVSPHYVLFGCEPSMPQTLALPDSHANGQRSTEWAQERLAIHNTVRRHLQEAQETQKRYADKRRRHVEHEVGQEVLLDAKHVTLDGSAATKLKTRFVGPFKIVEQVSPAAFRLAMPHFFRGHNVFHVSVLKPYKQMDKRFPLRAATSKPAPLYYQGGDAFWEVEKIVAMRGSKNQRSYRVKWKGDYPDTWEPLEHIEHTDAFKSFVSSLSFGKRRGRRSS